MTSPYKYPWYTYPNLVVSQYQDYANYITESCRLKNYIDNLIIEPRTLFHLITGAAMEEIISCDMDFPHIDFIKSDQWRQLFPFWIDNYIKEDASACVKIAIVSPNKHFRSDQFITPSFVAKTPEYEWNVNTEIRTITSNKFNVEISIFNTPVPHKCSYNKKYINCLIESGYDGDLDLITQTLHDIKFIESFYSSLVSKLDLIISRSGIATCFSYAVFNAECDQRSHMVNFKMFPLIKSAFSRLPPKMRIVAEWSFRPGS